MRVVSLLPSATEIVCALGARDELVGRSAECDYPEDVADVPVVLRPRTWDAEAPSAQIDARVRAVRGIGESLYELDVPATARLRPDLLLTQNLCRVCSVTESEVAEACRAAGVSPTILALTPRRLEEVWETVATIGRALGREREARELRERLEARAGAGPAPAEAPTVAVVQWLDPPILAGLWTPEIVARAGGRAWGVRAGEPARRTTWSEVERGGPELVVLSPCSFSVPRTTRELRDSPVRPEVERLRPPRGLWVADQAYFSRPGPRLADGIRLVADLLTQRASTGPMAVERWPGAGP